MLTHIDGSGLGGNWLIYPCTQGEQGSDQDQSYLHTCEDNPKPLQLFIMFDSSF